jgi:hypothetical protein
MIITIGHVSRGPQLAAGPVPAANFGKEPAQAQGAQYVFGIIWHSHNVLPRERTMKELKHVP